MPIYEYACPDCNHRFDKLQKISEDPITVCPQCAKENVRKLVSATSFVLKGGGWYKDHYGLKGSDSGDSSSSGSSDSKTISAPAAAPAAAAPASDSKPSTPTTT